MAFVTEDNDGVGRTLIGFNGEDNTILAQDGHDRLIGGNLHDTLIGGLGDDVHFGDTGRDVFAFEYDAFGFTGPVNYGNDSIEDFALLDDRIDLSRVGDSLTSDSSLGIGEFDTVLAIRSLAATFFGTAVQIQWDTTRLVLQPGIAAFELDSDNFIYEQSVVNDSFVLGGQNDWLATAGGDDFTDGGAGDDHLFGEQGNDTVLGGDGNDSVYGGTGDDIVWGDAGNDLVLGGDGNDLIYGNGGTNQVLGGSGADTLKLQQGAITGQGAGSTTFVDFDVATGDVIDVSTLGGLDSALSSAGLGIGSFETIQFLESTHPSGRALTWGNVGLVLDGTFSFTAPMFRLNASTVAADEALGAGNNIAGAGRGNDTLNGEGGNDTLFGEQGNDNLVGSRGNDLLHGGIGNDQLFGGLGIDSLFGSDGNDSLVAGFPMRLEGSDTDLLFGGAGRDLLTSYSGFASLTGGAGDDVYFLASGREGDRIIEAAGDGGGIDTVMVGLRSYTMDANVENAFSARSNGSVDDFFATLNQVYLSGGQGFRALLEALVNPRILASLKGANITGNALDNRIDGDDFSDSQVLIGGAGNDRINGLGRIDLIEGGKGNDQLDGGSGTDTVEGGVGRDTLGGGSGRDVLVGGAGADEFILDAPARNANADVIMDFGRTTDFILIDTARFTSIDGQSGRAVNRANFVQGTEALDDDDFLIFNEQSGQLFYDSDGSGRAEQVLIATVFDEFATILGIFQGSSVADLQRTDILIL